VLANMHSEHACVRTWVCLEGPPRQAAAAEFGLCVVDPKACQGFLNMSVCGRAPTAARASFSVVNRHTPRVGPTQPWRVNLQQEELEGLACQQSSRGSSCGRANCSLCEAVGGLAAE